jgi:hypothetical protein
VRLADLLEDAAGLTLLHGTDALDRSFATVFTTDLLDPSRYLKPDSLVLTGLMWWRDPADSEVFVRAVAGGGVVAVAAGEAALGAVPDDLVEACRRHDVALLGVPVDVSFGSITDLVARRHEGERGRRLALTLGRRRQLLSAVAEGRSLDDLLSLVAGETGLGCRILTPTGRVVARSTPSLSDPDLDTLSRAFLTAGRLPVTAELAGGTGSLIAVESGLGNRLASWFLVCDGRAADWPDDVAATVDELAAIVAVERQRADERWRRDQRVAGEVVAALASGQPSYTELAVHLADLGADPAGQFHVAVAEVVDGPPVLAELTLRDAALHVTDHPVTAMLPSPGAAIHPRGSLGVEGASDSADSVGIAELAGSGNRAVAILAGERPSAFDAGSPPDRPTVPQRLRIALERLSPGVVGHARLVAGISEPVTLDALSGALDEAAFAARLAATRTGTVCVVTSDEVSSYVALLTSVPDEVRRAFAARVLGPVVAYDERHRGDLLPTLDAFLEADGSWQRCAAALHVHVNTVRYRIGRIEKLTGRDLSRLEDRVDVLLALRSLPG